MGFPHGLVGKNSTCNAGELGSLPELGTSPGEGDGNPLQYSCLGNPMDRGFWQATVHAVARVGQSWGSPQVHNCSKQSPILSPANVLFHCWWTWLWVPCGSPHLLPERMRLDLLRLCRFFGLAASFKKPPAPQGKVDSFLPQGWRWFLCHFFPQKRKMMRTEH